MNLNLKEKIKFSALIFIIVVLCALALQWREIYFYLIPTQKAKAIIKMQSDIAIAPGKIAFESSRDWKPRSGQSVYILDNGSIEEAEAGLYPRFIQNKNTMAFINGGIRIFDLSRKNVKSVEVRVNISSVSGYDLSPDGKRVVFVDSKYDDHGATINNLYTMNMNGTGLKQLTFFNGEYFLGYPRWSPDGKQVLFNKGDGDRKKPANWSGVERQGPSLFVINSDGTGLKNLLQNTNYFGWHGSWSHDGKKIVFVVLSDDIGLNEIAIFDISVQKIFQITKAPSIKELGTNKNVKRELQEKVKKGYPLLKDYPVFSPNDTQVAFIGKSRGLLGGSELFVIDAGGGEIKRLTAPRWTRMGWTSVENFDWAA